MLFQNLLPAFVTGGLICAAAQILIDKTNLTPARIVVLFVSLGVVLTGLGLYDAVVDFGGAGATVPIVGFGTFMVRQREERMGRNPRTREEVLIPACKIPAFKAGKTFKAGINS